MSYTKLADPDLRFRQYLEALDYYLKETNLPVVFCENTGFDISERYKEYIEKGRLECFAFDGNNYDREKGKGYGEAMIILHAISHSILIKKHKYLIKITGRVVVRNITDIAQSPFLKFDHVFRSDWGGGSLWPTTVVFAMEWQDLQKILEEHIEEIREGEEGKWVFERVIARAMVNDKFIRIIPFFIPTQYRGVSGTSGLTYQEKSRFYTLSDNIFYWADMCAHRGNHVRTALLRFLYAGLMLLRRIL